MKTPPAIELRVAQERDAQVFADAVAQLTPDLAGFLHGWEADLGFGEYLNFLDRLRTGRDLPDGWVQSEFLFAFAADDALAAPGTIMGRASVRPDPHDLLLRQAGHIGYSVLPAYRNRGVATEILRQSLHCARTHFGLENVVLTCDEDNTTSCAIIERAGATYLGTEQFDTLPKPKRQYRLHTDPG